MLYSTDYLKKFSWSYILISSTVLKVSQMVEQGETLLQELQKECEERKLELQQLKQLVTKDQIGQRTLKV